MSLFFRFIIFALGLFGGLLILKFLDKIVYTVGKNDWAERKLGAGGSYKVWQIIACIIILLSFLYALLA